MTKYTFSLNGNNNNSFFTPKSKSTDYSKMLDDLILDDLKKKNTWLNYGSIDPGYTETIKIKIKDNTKDDLMAKFVKESSYDDAIKFFCNNCTLKGKKCPFIKDKIYYLADGTPFYITDDYITIGFDTYYFYEFGIPTFIGSFSDDFKKTIATIYTDGLKITIKK